MWASQCSIDVPAGVTVRDRSQPANARARSNIFRTRLLLGSFILLAAPLAGFIGSYLALWLMIYLAPGFFHGARGLYVQVFATLALTGLLVARAIWVSRSLPQVLGARPLARSDGVVVWRHLDSLASAAKIPTPKLYVLPASNVNAFATGPDPRRACIVITAGLLERLSLRELDGVLAHELSHVANQDTRFNSMAAAVFRIARFPAFASWMVALFFVSAALLAPGGPASLIALWSKHHQALVSSAMGWNGTVGDLGDAGRYVVLAVDGCLAIGLLLALLWPVIAWRLRRAIASRNEMSVDAQAAELTGDPLGLAYALAKICGGAVGQFPQGGGEDGSERSGCRPWPKGGAWRKETPSWSSCGGAVLKRSSGIEHACFAPLGGGLIFAGAHSAPAARIEALRRMAPDEPFDVTHELPEPGVIAAASAPVELEPVERCGAVAAIANGLLFGWIASSLIFDMRLVQLWVDSSYIANTLSGDLRSVAAANIFGFPGAIAAYAAMYKRGRLAWWPVVVMLMCGQYLPILTLKLVAGPLPMSSFSVLTAYLASLSEAVVGAALGVIAKRRPFRRLRGRIAQA